MPMRQIPTNPRCSGVKLAQCLMRAVWPRRLRGCMDRRCWSAAEPTFPTACRGTAGGLEAPNATSTLKTFFALDLAASTPQWQELAAWPGSPRMLAVAAVQDGSFFLVSGTDLSADAAGKPERRYLADAYRYQPQLGWNRIADIPHPVVAAPSPAPTIGPFQFLIIGGDDGSKVGFQPPQNHPGFPNRVLAYDTFTNVWSEVGMTPAPRVTAPTVKWGGQWLIVSGEQRPGIRSPEIWSLPAKPQ